MSRANLFHTRASGVLPKDNPRAPRPLIRHEYPVDPATDKVSIPNIGNGMENTWSSLDGHIVDDISEESFDNSVVNNKNYRVGKSLSFSENVNSVGNANAGNTSSSFVENMEEVINLSSMK